MSEKKIQLVVPMAGLGKRFVDANYTTLKPLIPIHGIPMIRLVIENLMSNRIGHVILIAQRETIEEIDLRKVVGQLDVPLTIVAVEGLTQGPADTILQARRVINNRYPMVIANSDQYIDAKLDDFYDALLQDGDSGAILTMEDDDPKWSYVELDDFGHVKQVREKVVISNQATVGVYGFSSARLAWRAFDEMWLQNDRTNGEFYVAPAYNFLAKSGVPINLTNLGPVSSVMYGLGTPQDLELFNSLPISRAVASAIQTSHPEESLN